MGVYLVIDNCGGGGGGIERSRVLGVSNFNSNLAQGVSTLISSCIAMYLKLACHYKFIADGHTHTHRQTDRQPQYNSFVLTIKLASKFVLYTKKYSGPLWLENKILAHNRLGKNTLTLKVREKKYSGQSEKLNRLALDLNDSVDLQNIV